MTHSVESKVGVALEPSDPRHEPERDKEEREHNLDKTIADSFPASDPPSTIPDPDHEGDQAA